MHVAQFSKSTNLVEIRIPKKFSVCTGRGPIITIFFLFLSDYFYVVQYGNKTVRHQDITAPVEKDSSAPRKFDIRTNRHRIFFQTNAITFFKIKSTKVKKNHQWSFKCNQNTGVKKSTSPTPGASNFHIWTSWNNQLYAQWASKKIYWILTNLSIFAYLLIFI
jgi:hypothetical protein